MDRKYKYDFLVSKQLYRNKKRTGKESSVKTHIIIIILTSAPILCAY